MFDFRKLAQKLEELGKEALPVLEAAAPFVGQAVPGVGVAVSVGQSVLDLIDKMKPVVNETDAAKLQALRDDLEPKVLAHAASTESNLG